jgi:UDP-N-acetylmuramoyl-L-alanyl-D-glutamate--2,6-diaminopimelate ligase
VGLAQGVNLETCKRALEKIEGIPGRMEVVIKEPFQVIVDYAHTPDALEKVYQSLTYKLKNLKTEKLICVLGSAGGGRDKWKRPKMGEIAARYCDRIILTDEDPYDENPMEIINQVAEGAFGEIRVNPRNYPCKSASIYKILDRREAIRKALSFARTGDIVIITGKGCEPWMCVAGGKKIPWDDRRVVREEFERPQT